MLIPLNGMYVSTSNEMAFMARWLTHETNDDYNNQPQNKRDSQDN